MTVPQSTRDIIIALSEDPSGPYTVREIAAQTGVSPATVSRILKESLDEDLKRVSKNETKDKAVSKKPRARARDKTPAVSEIETPPAVRVIEAVEITRDQTLGDMFDLLQIAKKNLADTIRMSDDSPQARNAVNGATKAVTEILRELGKWCGLQESVKSNDVKSRPASELSYEDCIKLLEDKS